MRNEIVERLKKFEKDKGVTILYACESGSRAWGFPSVDSDYDVRFFYTHKTEWYMSIDDRKDTMEDVGKILDFSGWELRKTLRLFRATNSSLYEKLQSPIVYVDRCGFHEILNNLMTDFYEPIRGLYHYLSLVHNFHRDELSGDMVKLKKYFYALRSVLAAKWIREVGGPPPIEFTRLRVLEKDEVWNDLVDGWLALKKTGTESLTVEKSILINDFIEKEMQEGNEYAKAIKKRKRPDSEVLNEYFRNWVR